MPGPLDLSRARPSEDLEKTRAEVLAVLEHELEQVMSEEQAEEILRRIEQITAGQTEQDRALDASTATVTPEQRINAAGREAGPATDQVARVLTETAAEAVAPTPEAEKVVEGAQEALGISAEGPQPTSRQKRGRDLLRRAILKRMGPLPSIDARIYLAINSLPRSRWTDRAVNVVSVTTNGGWIWLIGALLASSGANRRPRRQQILIEALPGLAGATWLVEYPIKTYFRRHRPFIEIVQALVVGKKPGSWSFPSGHTASSFAAASMLGDIWPRLRPLFFGLAASVGFSRIYVGAHYPGDVLSGVAAGVLISEVIRRLIRRIVA